LALRKIHHAAFDMNMLGIPRLRRQDRPEATRGNRRARAAGARSLALRPALQDV